MHEVCGSCGNSSVTLYEVQGYLGTYLFCPSCFGDEEGHDADWPWDEDENFTDEGNHEDKPFGFIEGKEHIG